MKPSATCFLFCLLPLPARLAELEALALRKVATVLPAFEPKRQGPVGRSIADEVATSKCMGRHALHLSALIPHTTHSLACKPKSIVHGVPCEDCEESALMSRTTWSLIVGAI
jgi:hypothetical protein